MENFSMTLAEQKTVVFPEVNIKWPEIKELRDYGDTVQVFKLGNTQF